MKLTMLPLSLGLSLSAMLALGAGCGSTSASGGQTFGSPDAAVDSLVTALRTEDSICLKRILGPSGDDILSSGDPVADHADVQRFLTLYDQEHWIRPEVGDVYTLLAGRDGWPFPVPIVRMNGDFSFDTETGREEILNRRIGRNELAAEQVCLAIIDAERDYVARRPMGGDLPLYAPKIVSDPGKKNGLYWPTGEDEDPSPLGPLVASATAEGYGANPATRPDAPAGDAATGEERTGDTPASERAYHGYRYRLLTEQGPHANGGSLSYMIDGKLIGGFGVVAYPADYGNSGIMTFITNHDGVVYQRNLGSDTEKIARAMTQFDPDENWARATDDEKPAQPE